MGIEVFFLLVLFFVAATFHQALYIIIPVATLTHIFVLKRGVLKINRFSRLFITLTIVVFLFFCIQSLYNFEIKTFALKGLLRYVVYTSFVVLILSFRKENIKLYFKCLSWILLFSIFLFANKVQPLGRYQAFFPHPNPLAYTQVITIYFLAVHKPFGRVLRALFLTFLTISLVFTETSGALIILTLILAYNFFISKTIKIKTKIFALAGLGALIPIAFLYFTKFTEQLASLEYLNKRFIMPRVRDFRGGGGYGSLVWRVIYWFKIYLTFLKESLFKILFGLNVDTMTIGNFPYNFIYKDPHNDFIKILVEYGFIGLTLFLNFLKNIFLILKKNVNLLILLLVPLFFDNAIVNFSIVLTLLTLFVYEYKLYSENGN